jgi:hypothetical protein
MIGRRREDVLDDSAWPDKDHFYRMCDDGGYDALTTATVVKTYDAETWRGYEGCGGDGGGGNGEVTSRRQEPIKRA